MTNSFFHGNFMKNNPFHDNSRLLLLLVFFPDDEVIGIVAVTADKNLVIVD